MDIPVNSSTMTDFYGTLFSVNAKFLNEKVYSFQNIYNLSLRSINWVVQISCLTVEHQKL